MAMQASISEAAINCTAASGEASPPVDLAHLRRYTMGDRVLELEVLGLFADQLPISIAALKTAASAKEWGMAAHTLKGSARAVGAWSLAALAESAERIAPDDVERGPAIQRIEDAAGAARAYIASLADAAV